MKEEKTFVLESDEGNIECRMITTLYSEEYQKNYLIYEYQVNDGNIYVSSYDPNSEDPSLNDVTDQKELACVSNLLSEYLE